MVSFLRKSIPLKYVTLVAAVSDNRGVASVTFTRLSLAMIFSPADSSGRSW